MLSILLIEIGSLNHLLWSYVGRGGGNTYESRRKILPYPQPQYYNKQVTNNQGKAFVITLNKNQLLAPPIEAKIILWLSRPPCCYCGDV
jgi:hypothetical protein